MPYRRIEQPIERIVDKLAALDRLRRVDPQQVADRIERVLLIAKHGPARRDSAKPRWPRRERVEVDEILHSVVIHEPRQVSLHVVLGARDESGRAHRQTAGVVLVGQDAAPGAWRGLRQRQLNLMSQRVPHDIGRELPAAESCHGSPLLDHAPERVVSIGDTSQRIVDTPGTPTAVLLAVGRRRITGVQIGVNHLWRNGSVLSDLDETIQLVEGHTDGLPPGSRALNLIAGRVDHEASGSCVDGLLEDQAAEQVVDEP